MVTIFAHRGASGHAPDNTVTAFDLAIEMGTLAIETDVKITRDLELVFFHDQVVGKPPRVRPVITLTADGLQRRARRRHSIAVPRVVDTFARYRRRGILKEMTWSIDVPARLVAGRLHAISAAFGLDGNVLFCNEQAGTLERWARHGIPREHLVWSIRDRQIARLGTDGVVQVCKNVGIGIVNVKEGWLSRRLAAAIHDAGLRLFIWDCHDERRLHRALTLGPEAIYTNYPDMAARVIARHERP